MALDMQRSRNDNIFVVTGHSKGQITLHEIKGLRPYHELAPFNLISKHLKTITDIHSQSVISIKFFGEIGPKSTMQCVSSDLDGVIYIC